MKKPLVIALVIGALSAGAGALGWYLGKRGPRLSGPNVKGHHAESLGRVPGSAHGLLSFDLGWMLDMTIDDNLGLFEEAGSRSDLRKALTDVSLEFFGIDVLRAEKATIWVSGPPSAGVAARIDGGFDGALKGPETVAHDGADLVRMTSGAWAALVDGALVVGTRDAVAAGVDAAKDRDKSIRGSEAAHAAHEKALDAIDDGAFVASIHLGSFAGLLPEPMRGLESAALALNADGGYSFAATGAEATLASLVALWKEHEAKAGSAIEALRADAVRDGPAGEALGLTLARAKMEDLRASVVVEQSGDVATVAADGPGGIVTLYLGALVGIAVPAFQMYLQRARDVQMEMHEMKRVRERELEQLRNGAPGGGSDGAAP